MAGKPTPATPVATTAINPRATAETTIARMLERSIPQIAHALPATLGLRPETIVRAVLTEVRLSADLAECSPVSIVRSAFECAALGLVPNRVTGHVYLIPFKGECTTIAGYRGLCDIARRSGNVSTLDAYAVHEGDEFDFALGDKPYITHKPDWRRTPPGPTIAFYAVAVLRDGGRQMVVMSVPEVEYIRSLSKQPQGKLWRDHYDEAGKKTVLRRLWKSLPISVEALNLLESDRKREEGEPDVDVPASDFTIGDPVTGASDTNQPHADAKPAATDAKPTAARADLVRRLTTLCQERAEAAGDLFGGMPPIANMDEAELSAAIAKIESVKGGGK